MISTFAVDPIVVVSGIAQRNQDGFTVNLRKGFVSPISGYCVAYKATQDGFGFTGLTKAIEHAQANDGFVGGWLNTENGEYYFDSVRIIENREEAQRFAEEQEQIAYFHLDTFATIPTTSKAQVLG
jgi:hypothetical protein